MLRRHGGTPRIWRTDRLATVIVPGSRDVQPSFAPVAKFYGVVVEPCPPRRANRKGSVESSVRYVCGRSWRTMTAVAPAQAQVSLDVFYSGTADARRRKAGAGGCRACYQGCRPSCSRPVSLRSAGVARPAQVVSWSSAAKSAGLAPVRNA